MSSPIERRLKKPLPDSAPRPSEKKKKKVDPRHDLSFFQGFRDTSSGVEIDSDDYYGLMGQYGFFDNTGKKNPLTHSTDVSTVLQYYDTNLKNTPLDTRKEVAKVDVSKIAEDLKTGNYYSAQNFAENAAKTIAEKTHRVLTDPIRTFQSQILIDIQNHLNRLRNLPHISATDKIMEFSSMMLTVNMLALERQTDLLDIMEKQLLFDKEESKPVGKTFYAEMTLTTNSEATRLDFVDPKNNKNVPGNASISINPNGALYYINLIFDSGDTLYFSTNEPANSIDTRAKLILPPQTFNFAPNKKSLQSINLRAAGSTNANIRIIGLF